MEITLTDRVTEVNKSAIRLLSAVSEEQFNQVPYQGGWTMGQAGEHVLKSCNFIFMALSGPTERTDRDPQQHVAQFESIFLNLNNVLDSPDFIKPSDDPKQKADLIFALKEKMDQIETIANAGDLDLLSTAFEFPRSGLLTRYEWLNFFYCHTTRHIWQFEKINNALGT